MALLKTLFPLSFGAKKDVVALIINIVVYLVVCAIAGVVIGFLSDIAVVGVIFTIVGSFIGLYGLIGIVLSVLDYLKVLK